jgi:hypothetical protein
MCAERVRPLSPPDPSSGWVDGSVSRGSAAQLRSAGLIHDQRYRTDPDAEMPMPD